MKINNYYTPSTLNVTGGLTMNNASVQIDLSEVRNYVEPSYLQLLPILDYTGPPIEFHNIIYAPGTCADIHVYFGCLSSACFACQEEDTTSTRYRSQIRILSGSEPLLLTVLS